MKKSPSQTTTLLLFLLLIFSPGLYSQTDDDMEDLRRRTPSGQYIDPASFFRFHGYVTLIYSEAGKDFGKDRQPQILVTKVSPRTGDNEGGFTNDAALFVGGEMFDRVGSVIELHFVGNGLDPVLTEAKVVWDVVNEEDSSDVTFRVIGGRYWWPFGGHNHEWFSALNSFNILSPAACLAVPAHYNEVGLMVEGEVKLSEKFGGNYVLSLGNGVPGFDLMDNIERNGYDYNNNRTVTFRGGLVYLGDATAEVGFSFARGTLRTGMDNSFTVMDPRRYPASFTSFGLDARLQAGGFGFNGYYYTSEESLSNAGIAILERSGYTLEPSFSFAADLPIVHRITLVGRYGFGSEQDLNGSKYGYSQLGGGVNLHITKTFILKLSYSALQEMDAASELDNDLLTLSFTAEF